MADFDDDDTEDQNEPEGEPSELQDTLPSPEEMGNLMESVAHSASVAPSDPEQPDVPDLNRLSPTGEVQELAATDMLESVPLGRNPLMPDTGSVRFSTTKAIKSLPPESPDPVQEAAPHPGENLGDYYDRMQSLSQAAEPERRKAAFEALKGVPGLDLRDGGDSGFGDIEKIDAAADRDASIVTGQRRLREADIAFKRLMVDVTLDHAAQIDELRRYLEKNRS